MQAAKGGQRGINGEFYKGGQFLPGSESTIKGRHQASNSKATGKQEIAPYKWEIAPSANHRSLYSMMVSACNTISRNRSIGPIWNIVRVDWNTLDFEMVSDEPMDYGMHRNIDVKALYTRWKAGEVWVDLSEFTHVSEVTCID